MGVLFRRLNFSSTVFSREIRKQRTFKMYPFSEKEISLYFSRTCPFSLRVVLALTEANVPYEPFELDTAKKPEWFSQVNSDLKVPVMRLPSGQTMVESFLLVEYIAEKYPQSRLMPDSPFDKYKVRLFVEYFGSNMISLPRRLMTVSNDESAKAELYTEIIQKLRALNEKLLENSDIGPYFFGQHFTAADIASIPSIGHLDMALDFNNLDIKSVPGLERFNVWKSAIMARPSYSSSAASRSDLVEAYRKYIK
ncbi:Glutathione S-transferase omega-1 [Smittium mucronatum]|uniref:Glutathione S-transferase omega-1 n=1 Tax=Smittium mucronatum TaxID=133383 RepID=A0A1R0GUK5_9FUNG|nr:Glutathione S-transferase omega-1 [Smittium mucronatum]